MSFSATRRPWDQLRPGRRLRDKHKRIRNTTYFEVKFSTHVYYKLLFRRQHWNMWSSWETTPKSNKVYHTLTISQIMKRVPDTSAKSDTNASNNNWSLQNTYRMHEISKLRFRCLDASQQWQHRGLIRRACIWLSTYPRRPTQTFNSVGPKRDQPCGVTMDMDMNWLAMSGLLHHG